MDILTLNRDDIEWEVEVIEYCPEEPATHTPETLSFDVYLVHYKQVWQHDKFVKEKRRILIHDNDIKGLFYDDAKSIVEGT